MHLDIFPIHYFDTTYTIIDIQDISTWFVHLQRFEFVIYHYGAVIAVLYKQAMLHLDLSWVEGYFVITYVRYYPI